MMEIKENMVVLFRYIMKNNRGEVIENIMEGPSKSYLHGSSIIQPFLQRQFEGLMEGDIKAFSVDTDTDASPSGNYSFDIIIDKVRPASEAELQLGYPIDVTEDSCGPGCDC